MTRILLTGDCQHVDEVVKSKIIGTIKAGDSCNIQANFPGSIKPNLLLLYLPEFLKELK